MSGLSGLGGAKESRFHVDEACFNSGGKVLLELASLLKHSSHQGCRSSDGVLRA